jgi:PKD repeat protein
MAKVEKPSKVFTTGIGAYFLVWIVCWVLFITPLIKPPIAMFAYSPQKPAVRETITFDATASKGKIAEYKWDFGDKNVTTITSPIIYHAYASSANYTVTLTVKDDQGLTDKTETILTVSLNVTSP